MAQQHDILKTTRDAIHGRKALIAGACAANLRQSIEYAGMAKALGYDACVACPPYYYPLAQNEIYRFYVELARKSALPVILYHVPFFTSGIDAATVEQLLKIPNIVGIKDSSANMKRIAHLCQFKDQRADFLVYTGTDDCLLPALVAGVDGSMTALAAGTPSLVAAVYKAYAASDLEKAAAAQKRMMRLLKRADALPFPLGYKLAAEAYHGLFLTKRCHQLMAAKDVEAARAEIAVLVRASSES